MSKIVKLVLCLILPIVGLIFYYKEHYLSNTTEIDFKPFFRVSISDPDYIPKLPELTGFDEGILKVCGDWGVNPNKEDFRVLLDFPQHQKTLKAIYDNLDHGVITPNASLELFKDELTKIWFKSKGFEHIFCGQPSKSKLGGMHFIGRYVQAQENKWAGEIWNDRSLCSKLEVKPPIYTFGMQYLNSDKEVRVKCPSGYAYNLHADDILILATKAFKSLGKDGMCLYKMEDDNYYSVFVRKKNSIRTFYPNLEPKCDNNRTDCNCS